MPTDENTTLQPVNIPAAKKNYRRFAHSEALLQQKDLPFGAKAFYLIMWETCDSSNGYLRASVSYLAERASLSPNTVDKWIDVLIAAGWVKKKRPTRYNQRKHKHTNQYWLVSPYANYAYRENPQVEDQSQDGPQILRTVESETVEKSQVTAPEDNSRTAEFADNINNSNRAAADLVHWCTRCGNQIIRCTCQGADRFVYWICSACGASLAGRDDRDIRAGKSGGMFSKCNACGSVDREPAKP